MRFARPRPVKYALECRERLLESTTKMPFRAEAQLLRQGQDPLLERAVRKRGELVEEGRDDERAEHAHDELEDGHGAERPYPPQAPRSVHEPEKAEQDGDADDSGNCESLQGVHHVEPRGGLVESEPLLRWRMWSRGKKAARAARTGARWPR